MYLLKIKQNQYHFPIDVPSKPMGPLLVSDLTETSVMLSWQPPAYDGGSEVTGYLIEVKQPTDSTWRKVSQFVSCV